MVQMREMTLGADSPGGGSLLKGQELATTFSFLRPNDLVWNYVVGNYLKGETPPPFDLLYWNSDSTNLPGPMYCWYLRNTYLENNLMKPGKLQVCGEKVDLRSIKVPTYIYASREDHIVPWDARLPQHPGAGRQDALRARRVGPHRRRDQSAGQGQAQPLGRRQRRTCRPMPSNGSTSAKEHPGSWWPDWATVAQGPRRQEGSRTEGAGQPQIQAIEPAPGRYVKQKA